MIIIVKEMVKFVSYICHFPLHKKKEILFYENLSLYGNIDFF